MPTITIRFSRINHYCVVKAYVSGVVIYHREAPEYAVDRVAWLEDAKNAAFVWLWSEFPSVCA